MYIVPTRHMRRILTILILLTAAILTAGAQTPVYKGKTGDRSVIGTVGRSSGSTVSGSGMLGGSISKEPALPSSYGKYKDEGLQDLNKAMEEREWGSEDTAWKRASSLHTIDAYQKYLARYPYGLHAGNANANIIDIRVSDALNRDHNDLPEMARTVSEDDSPTSTIIVENTTRYPLTVMYSGIDSKSVTIPPGSKTAVTLTNGRYRIAASVPVASVIPFAGGQDFSGGRYETGFCIVRR